jgi:hypothetical protein
LNNTKQPEKNKMDIFTVASTGDRKSVKISDIQNKSIIIKIFDAITSMMVISSSLTSSILGRLYRNRIHVTYLYVSTQIYVRTIKKVKSEEIV